MKAFIFSILVLLFFITSCNKNDVITEEIKQAPIIELDSETGIYTIKVGRELTIAPTYKYANNALYAWTVDGKLLSSESILKYTWNQEQHLYIRLRVDTPEGYAEEELKVEVLELTPPTISIIIPSKGLKVPQNTDYILSPDIQHDDLENFRIEWVRDGEIVGTEKAYTFHEKELGTYSITIRASNIDGETIRDFDVEVVETMPYSVRFPTPSYTQTSTDRYTFAGRPVYLRPLLEYFDYPQYQWQVNGKIMEAATDRVFKFTPTTPGEYFVAVTVTEKMPNTQPLSRNITRSNTSITTTVKVICEEKTEQERYRQATATSSGIWDKVYEFIPAPGQFINELSQNTGFIGNETTPQQAIEYATKRLNKKAHVSLGSFGGYIIIGFDHSIAPSGREYDFAIQGNAFNSSSGGSNEPGIVWVMQDINGNGQPDDEWYELKGSETGIDGTIQDYEVTYYRPAPRAHTPWVDSEGNSGSVDMNAYHGQEYYYPNWIKEDSYTLYGTRLTPRNNQDPVTGYWANNAYEWGYVDNMGSDNLVGGNVIDGSGQRNGFKIANAIYHDGTPVKLQYIDFIKVQCGVLSKSGWLGEISTEVFSFEDLSITNNQ